MLCFLAEINRRQLALKPAPDQGTVYSKELEGLQKMLQFPEEVAILLTETEYSLFYKVSPLCYVRQVTCDMSRVKPDDTQKTVQDLIKRFTEVILGDIKHAEMSVFTN